MESDRKTENVATRQRRQSVGLRLSTVRVGLPNPGNPKLSAAVACQLLGIRPSRLPAVVALFELRHGYNPKTGIINHVFADDVVSARARLLAMRTDRKAADECVEKLNQINQGFRRLERQQRVAVMRQVLAGEPASATA